MAAVYFITLSFAQTENWIYRYNGSANSVDQCSSIVYGADGNVYIAGSSIDSITGWEFAVTSLTTSGDTNWLYKHNGPGAVNGWDAAKSIIYGADGNIYAAGGSFDTSVDFTVISLSIAGDTNWTYRYNGLGNNRDEALSIVYGGDGNIYAAGYCYGAGATNDFTVVSITSAGDLNWVYVYDGPSHNYDEAWSVAYGADGNIYAAGYSVGFGTDWDFMVISLNAAGDTNWTYRYDGLASSVDAATSITCGADENIYVAGACFNYTLDLTIVSLTTTGDTNWTYSYDGGGPGPGFNVAQSIIYGANGNIYAAGYSSHLTTCEDFTVVSLTPAGDTNWIYWYDGGEDNDQAISITEGQDGSLYAAGYSYRDSTGRDFTVISLTDTGDTNWVYWYDGPGSNHGVFEAATSIVYGADGNVYTAGYSYGLGTDKDCTVISLSPDLGVEDTYTNSEKNAVWATITKGILILPKGKASKIFDITGRQIHTFNPAPGIYFIEIDGEVQQKIIKIK